MHSKKLPIALLCLLSTPIWATLPQDSRRPGGIAVIAIPPHIQQLNYQGRAVLMTQESSGRYAVFGIPLTTPSGMLTLDSNAEPIQIAVAAHHYPQQHLKLNNSAYVHPNPEQLKRYQAEAQQQNQVYQSFSASTWQTLPKLIRPTSGSVSPSFGRQRFFNGEARAPHSGLDIKAPIGQKVVSPATGKVVETGDFFFNGKTVMIDHGQGLISMLCHLSQIDVHVGDLVQAGQTVGLVGNTGRVTGAHLHWSVSLNDARVDPQLFLKP